jgi:hypothetical protein|tara:strand:+ start:124 stop:495 length:372 start_codon:yes stop_codon:yes gene_type:complete
MKDLIKKKVLSRNWSFNEIADLSGTITSLCNDLAEELTLMEKFKLANEVRIKESYVGMELYQVLGDIVYTSLKLEVAETIKELLNTATINFGGNINEISENGLVGESNKKRTTNAKKKDDDQE